MVLPAQVGGRVGRCRGLITRPSAIKSLGPFLLYSALARIEPLDAAQPIAVLDASHDVTAFSCSVRHMIARHSPALVISCVAHLPPRAGFAHQPSRIGSTALTHRAARRRLDAARRSSPPASAAQDRPADADLLADVRRRPHLDARRLQCLRLRRVLRRARRSRRARAGLHACRLPDDGSSKSRTRRCSAASSTDRRSTATR